MTRNDADLNPMTPNDADLKSTPAPRKPWSTPRVILGEMEDIEKTNAAFEVNGAVGPS